MLAEFSSDQRKRLAAFEIGDDDLRILAERRGTLERQLPALLEKLHESFSAWPEIKAALTEPAVHKVRLDHWLRVARGDLGHGFLESARHLASVFYEHGVPGYAVAICHSVVIGGIFKELASDT